MPTTQHVENRCYVSKFNVELDEICDISLFFPAEYFGSVGFEVEQDRQSQRFLWVKAEMFVFKEGHTWWLDGIDDLWVSTFVVGDREDCLEDAIVKGVTSSSVVVFLSEVGDVKAPAS